MQFSDTGLDCFELTRKKHENKFQLHASLR
jgi:hypothetical protein